MHFHGGARGHIWASQVAVGNENNLTLAVYGTKGSIRWSQENPNNLWFSKLGAAPQMFTRGGGSSYPSAAAVTRIPAGHPEGYLEAFATLYREAAEVIIASGKRPNKVRLLVLNRGLKVCDLLTLVSDRQKHTQLGLLYSIFGQCTLSTYLPNLLSDTTMWELLVTIVGG